MYTIKHNSEPQTFKTFEDLEKYLNSALYYCKVLYIEDMLTHDFLNYQAMSEDDLKQLFEDVKNYDLDIINIVQTF